MDITDLLKAKQLCENDQKIIKMFIATRLQDQPSSSKPALAFRCCEKETNLSITDLSLVLQNFTGFLNILSQETVVFAFFATLFDANSCLFTLNESLDASFFEFYTITVENQEWPLSLPTSKLSVKYIANFHIQIQQEKKFKVTTKILGNKGNSIKTILSEILEPFKDKIKEKNPLKLRLRGKGSGFNEGKKYEESKEPLQLCISSKYREVYLCAVTKIEKMLLDLYFQYEEWVKAKKGNLSKVPKSIKKFEYIVNI